ncbi:MAG: DUF2851 family protein, partial [Dehalococcoidia bacterium]|nr:DUF2851 family protein [Dehalococcoidia bacterium]
MLIPPGPSSESLPRKKATEEDLSLLWYGGVFARPGLRTRGGRRVRVLYRGLPNGERGPDYIGAVLSLGRGKPKAGDIELHLRTSQWRAHGHHKDAHYERVILHVVWQDDDPRPTPLPGGRQVPVLALEGLSAVPGEIGFVGEPCRAAATWGSEWLGGVLDKAGEDRFLAKAARLEGDMAALPAQEVLYQALAETLGYSQNRRPFRLLAGSLPLGTLEGFLWGKATDRQEAIAQALLLGSAGLLPRQRGLETGPEWEDLLEQLWKASGLEPQLGLGDWSLGVRPENHPARRLAGLASLVVESLGDGLVPWALASLTLRDREQGMWHRLKQAASGYWTGHFDFGRAGRRLS